MSRNRIVALVLSVVVAGCEKARLDEEVRRLCKMDGGVKVYEVVRLSAERFNQWNQINFYRPTQGENALGMNFIFKEHRHHYSKGNPSMSRTHYQVYRRADGKLLGESVLYARGGGDLPSPLHDSSFHCPDPNEAGDVALLSRVFVKEGAK